MYTYAGVRMAASEEEIYSIMFTSLKHPVRRKILRMLANKPMTFMEMVENLGVSTSHLTYHLESLGELVSKLDGGTYKLSTFGLATVSAMNGVEEAPQIERKRRWKLEFKWKVAVAALLVAVILLSSVFAIQSASLNQMSSSQQSLSAENQQLMSWGIGADKVSTFLQNMTQIDVKNYTLSSDSDTITYRTDFNVAEEVIKYSLTSDTSNLDVQLRLRSNHFSRYELDLGESSPIFVQPQPTDVLQNANATLYRYQAYSGDAYLAPMINLLSTVTNASTQTVTQGNMALQITNSGSTIVFYWMYYQDGIYFQSKGLQMKFQNNILTIMTDGYFLFTVDNTNLAVSQEQAVNIAKNYVKTMSYTIEGQQYSGFNVVPGDPLSTQLVPHTRGNSVVLIPYWYLEMKLTSTYPGGYNEVTVGIYADTGQVADIQVLSTSTET
jgi:DNA-binding transcriptional ArsR family regulator